MVCTCFNKGYTFDVEHERLFHDPKMTSNIHLYMKIYKTAQFKNKNDNNLIVTVKKNSKLHLF